MCRTVVRQHTRPGHGTTDAAQMAQKAQLRALPGSGPEGGLTSGKPIQLQSQGYDPLCALECLRMDNGYRVSLELLLL